ncbi:MAG: EF-P beta-lysylation protein EpmB [Gammaproteobacteria bacterium]|nr:EF-P beta-lysylation protein EpmB [Gammaproteobacteria bacterium]
MLPPITTPWPPATWQKSLAMAIRDPRELLQLLDLEHLNLADILSANAEFPLRVPRGYVARMKKGDPNDPLLRQVLPLGQELALAPGFSVDPVGDQNAVSGRGLLQKYQGRVLVLATATCAIHCRYCFRRHFPYGDHKGNHQDWTAIIEPIAADTTIHEVILSGGDPLSLADHYLADLVAQLNEIPHLKRLRVHSRYPIVLPERIDNGLLKWIDNSRLKPVFVMHCNHANEIDHHVATALATLSTHGVALFNQAVLLKGINDNATTLIELSERLFEHGVTPYYLHLLDRVQGAAHFDVPIAQAHVLIEALRHKLPGYLVPQLVREVAGAPYKIPATNVGATHESPLLQFLF